MNPRFNFAQASAAVVDLRKRRWALRDGLITLVCRASASTLQKATPRSWPSVPCVSAASRRPSVGLAPRAGPMTNSMVALACVVYFKHPNICLAKPTSCQHSTDIARNYLKLVRSLIYAQLVVTTTRPASTTWGPAAVTNKELSGSRATTSLAAARSQPTRPCHGNQAKNR